MITKNNDCSMISHSGQKAFRYCCECNIFMCHQCFNHHKGLFNNHHLIDLTQNNENIFTGICPEENHKNKLDRFCKSHNQLCCSSCIGINGKHNKCELCKIEDIKEEKKTKLENNIKILEDISINIKESLDKTKNYYNKIEEQKEELKSKIMKIITNLRNKLNEREDELLSELDILFLNISPSEKLINEYEKIPKKINEILDKRKSLNEKLNDSFLLNSYINDCINIEKDFLKIKEINDSVIKYNINTEIKLYFFPEEKDIDKIYKNIKSFGKIYQKENEINNLYITESEKENKELNSKIKDLENIKEKNIKEINEIKKELDKVKTELNKERNNNNNLRNNLNNSKIRFTMRSRCALNKCLDMKSMNYGNSPHLWDYSRNNVNQIFELENNNDGTYSIKSSGCGFYLGFDSNKISFRKRKENSQSFYVHHFEDGFYLFQEKCGAVIDLSDFHTHNGANIGKCGRNNSEAQQWKLLIHL